MGASGTTGFGAGGFFAGGGAVRAGSSAAAGFAGAFFGAAAGLSKTLRTRSAIWSGTTLSWFFASKTPPRR
jgi:hypothetical protein